METKTTHPLDNKLVLTMANRSQNQSIARTAVAAFVAPLDPSLEEMIDIKTAVSEAVTNAMIHGYGDSSPGASFDSPDDAPGEVVMTLSHRGRVVTVVVADTGVGIADVDQAMLPTYTSRPDTERSGMGFTMMECFMDDMRVESALGVGTTVTMTKKLV